MFPGTIPMDSSPVSGSTKPVTSGGVYDALKGDTTESTSSTKFLINKAITGIANGAIASINGASVTATINGFTLHTGAVVRIMTTSALTSANPTLNISSTGAKPIRVVRDGALIDPVAHRGSWSGASSKSTRVWDAYTTLELIYNGTYWVVMGNPVFNSYANTSSGTGYVVYSNGLIEQWGRKSASTKTVSYLINFSTANSYTFNFIANKTASTANGWHYYYTPSTTGIYVMANDEIAMWQAIGY